MRSLVSTLEYCDLSRLRDLAMEAVYLAQGVFGANPRPYIGLVAECDAELADRRLRAIARCGTCSMPLR